MKPKSAPKDGRPAQIRCAIYTRKSSEEGLEQDYNSLHAQRDACEAYIRSQVGEGWRASPTPYDDGGISGATIERPGLQSLLADVERGLIDVVVVYKIDRLTRSLTDFAKIVDRFDAKSVSFVSVTQSFDTTSSMGRLTLNMLLSFAQFEREITGERIRDKIAASKKKGMWMGGAPPLGYDPPTTAETHKLVVNEPEAVTVRMIFRRYLEVGSVHVLKRQLAAEGVRSKVSVAQRSGRMHGGAPLNRGALYHLLRNRTYLGEIVHGEVSYPGLHEAIVEPELFEAVARRLDENTRAQTSGAATPITATLRGRVFDANGAPMSPTVSYGRTKRAYRYYVSAELQQGASRRPDELRRVPAPQLESFVAETFRRLGVHGAEFSVVRRLEIHPQHVRLVIAAEAVLRGPRKAALQALQSKLLAGETLTLAADDAVELLAPQRLSFIGGRTWIVDASNKAIPTRGRTDQAVAKALKVAHATLGELGAGPASSIDRLREAKAVAHPHLRAIARLAFLAPDIQSAILDGRLAPQLNVGTLTAETFPLAWADQRALAGL